MALALELDGARGFSINGVPDGKYSILAIAGLGAKETTLAPPRPVLVNGTDLNGLNLTLIPIPRVSGTATVETVAPDPKSQCKPGKGLKSCLITASLSEIEDDVWSSLDGSGISLEREAVPDDNGGFQLQLLGGPGRYHLDFVLPDDELYLKSITIPPDVPNRAPFDASAGFPVAVGQKNNTLAVTLGEGAAGLSGRVVQPAGGDLPARVGLALIPAEPGSEDDVLRYAQVTVHPDGTFQLRNLPPGRYYVLARSITDEELKLPNSQRPWWNREFRKNLYADAQKAGKTIEFRPCQRTADYSLQYVPPSAAPKAASK
jgi:hypothetical protein